MNGEWDPLAEKVAPENIQVFGVELRVGSRVRLWPQTTADIIDMGLKGKVAIIEAIEQLITDGEGENEKKGVPRLREPK